MEQSVGHYLKRTGHELYDIDTLVGLGTCLFLINTRGHGDDEDSLEMIVGRFHKIKDDYRFGTVNTRGIIQWENRPVDEIHVEAVYTLLD